MLKSLAMLADEGTDGPERDQTVSSIRCSVTSQDSSIRCSATTQESGEGSPGAQFLRRLRAPSKDSTGSGEYDSIRRSFDARSFTAARVDSQITKRYDMNMQEIGVGGYGKVYIAKDRMFKDRLVAIKKLVKYNAEKREDFAREVAIMKTLDHPNICRLFETYEEDRFLFFVIEYCEGGDLFDRIMDDGTIAEHEVAGIVTQVASALKYAHGKGIAHRDMKPENVCFYSHAADSTDLKVIDWGFGKYFGLTRMKSSVGSSTYAAPEVLDAKKDANEGYTSACDLWSLGVLTYISLCGKPPFWGSHNEQLRRMRQEKYPMSSELWQQTSSEAKDFIRGLLKPEPKERWAIEDILRHPWLQSRIEAVEPDVFQEVLMNLEQFSHAPDFFSMCVASVARQLDHRSLLDIHKVFRCLDSNVDGELDLLEIRAGFVRVFGEGSEEVNEVEQMFSRLDLNGSGRISYTEFCAAGIGEARYTEEHVLWAAFKIFDVHDDGRITKEEMKQVLSNADVNKVWSQNVCDEVAQAVMEEFGGQDGIISFADWLTLMRECAASHSHFSPKRQSRSYGSIGGESSIGLSSSELPLQPILSRRTLSAGSLESGSLSESQKEVSSRSLLQEPDEFCICGNKFMPDAIFCRMCGRKRGKANTPTCCAAGFCKQGCTIS